MGSGYWNMVPEPRKGREEEEEGRKGEYGFRLLEYGAGAQKRKRREKEEEEVRRGGEYGFRLLEYGAGAQKRKRREKEEE